MCIYTFLGGGSTSGTLTGGTELLPSSSVQMTGGTEFSPSPAVPRHEQILSRTYSLPCICHVYCMYKCKCMCLRVCVYVCIVCVRLALVVFNYAVFSQTTFNQITFSQITFSQIAAAILTSSTCIELYKSRGRNPRFMGYATREPL